jgi:hypothetical protein
LIGELKAQVEEVKARLEAQFEEVKARLEPQGDKVKARLEAQVEEVKARLEASQLHAVASMNSLEEVRGYVSHLQSKLARLEEANANRRDVAELAAKVAQLEARGIAPQASEASQTTEQRISSLQRQFDELAVAYATFQAN